MKRGASGFTLIELALSLGAGAVVLIAIFGVFSRAIHLRDDATQRTRTARVQAHAVDVLRNDLRQARISGGTLAATLIGSQESQGGSFPGYLKFMTTTARDVSDEVPSADLQQVEYFVATDSDAENPRAGSLVRAVDGGLLAPVRETPPEEPLLTGIESMEIAFFDGDAWQDSWEITEDDKTLPKAVRVRLQPAAAAREVKPPVIEVLVPWSTQAAIEVTLPAEGAAP